MVGIVEADGDEIAGLADAGAKARIARNEGQLIDIGRGDLGDGGRRQVVANQIGDNAADIADFAGGIDQTGLLLAGLAVANEFHSLSLR